MGSRFTLLVIALLLLAITPARAGGVATVYLDLPITEATVDEPVEIGFMVMQHDVSPANVDRAYVHARHRDTGATYEAEATQEGPTGHYVASLTFPAAGSWKWMIVPEPFAGTSFPSVLVSEKTEASASEHIVIQEGNCGGAGQIVHDGTDAPLVADTSGMSTAKAAIDLLLADLIASGHSIAVGPYCGDIVGKPGESELAVPLRGPNGSAVAILRSNGSGTTISVYVVSTAPPQANGPVVHVEISGSEGGWEFLPSRVEVTAGTTVVWTNRTEVAHTVTGVDLAFEDSGPFGAGESYSLTFSEPGSYSYFCSPHPFMVGTVILTE